MTNPFLLSGSPCSCHKRRLVLMCVGLCQMHFCGEVSSFPYLQFPYVQFEWWNSQVLSNILHFPDLAPMLFFFRCQLQLKSNERLLCLQPTLLCDLPPAARIRRGTWTAARPSNLWNRKVTREFENNSKTRHMPLVCHSYTILIEFAGNLLVSLGGSWQLDMIMVCWHTRTNRTKY